MKSAMVLIHQKKAIQYFDKKIENIKNSLVKLDLRCQELENRTLAIERSVKPDEIDIFNINRRIEILAQRIAMLESGESKGWWPFQRGGLVK